MAFNKNIIKATTDSELLSYIINVTPELQSEIDLPVQGESIAPIGQHLNLYLVLPSDRHNLTLCRQILRRIRKFR